MKKGIAWLLALTLLICAAPAASALDEEAECFDFDFRFHLEEREVPLLQREHQRGYAELLESLELKGNAAWIDYRDAMDFHIELIPLTDPAASIPIRLFGRSSDVCIDCPLLGPEPYFMGNTDMIMSFGSQFRLVTGLPVSSIALLNPYITLNYGLKNEIEAWQAVIPPAEDGGRITTAQLEKVCRTWDDLMVTDSAFLNWLDGIYALAPDQTLVEQAVGEMPEAMVNAAGGEDLIIVEEEGALRCLNAAGETIFIERAEEQEQSLEVCPPDTGTTYTPYFFYHWETDGNTQRLTLKLNWDGKPGGESDLPESMLQVSLDAEGIPVTFPADAAMKIRVRSGGYAMPAAEYTLQIETTEAGSVKLTVLEPAADTETGEMQPVMTCTGTVIRTVYPDWLQYEYSELSMYPRLLIASYRSVEELMRVISPNLLKQGLDFLYALPMRACQSIMDDLEGYGLMETLLSGLR